MLINTWHTILDMPKKDLDWHINDIKEEIIELEEAKGLIEKWSELSDIIYTCTRANWSGYKDVKFPFSRTKYFYGSIYMIPKYSLRWLFFRHVAKKSGANCKIREVRNPTKIEKLKHIAEKYNIDPNVFTKNAEETLKWWFLLY